MITRIRADQLPRVLRAEGHKVARAIPKAARASAYRLRALCIERTNALCITDTGLFKNAWRVGGASSGTLAQVYNDAPYAGVIEMGARPHAVSKEGREAITRWAMRKLGLDEVEAKRVAYLVAQKLKNEGQKGHFIARDAVPQAREYFAQEIERLLAVPVSVP